MIETGKKDIRLLAMQAKARIHELNEKAKRYESSPTLQAAIDFCLQSDDKLNIQVKKLENILARYSAMDRLTRADQIRKDYAELQVQNLIKRTTEAKVEAKRRETILNSIKTEHDIAEEMRRCQEDIFYWWNNWVWTVDPRDPVLYAVPFQLFDFQKSFVAMLEEVTYTTQEDLVCEKSRDQGVSWMVLGWMFYHWLFSGEGEQNHFLCASMKADDVDKLNVPSTLMEKVRVMIRMLPDWMMPKGFSMKEHGTYMRITNPDNGNLIAGTKANGNTARGGRFRAVLHDEHAFNQDAEASAAASSQSTQTRLFVSTHAGKLTHFFNLTMGDLRKMTFHWYLHPWKDDRWYAFQTLKMSKSQLAQEVDIDPEYAQSGRIYPEYDERRHVITWKEFADEIPNAIDPVSGRIRIPGNWFLKRGNDWASGAGDSANVTLWFATAPEGTITKNTRRNIEGAIFIYREYVAPPYSTVRDVARFIHEVQKKDGEQLRMSDELISHERATERITFDTEYGLPYRAWSTDVNAGIARVREYLQIEGTEIHPFRPQFEGAPKLFFVSSTEEGDCVYDAEQDKWRVRQAESAAGLRRLRAEMVSYHYKDNTLEKPEKIFDDAMDTLRSVAFSGFPPRALISEKERFESSLPVSVQARTIQEAETPEQKAALYMGRLNYLKEAKAKFNPEISRYNRLARNALRNYRGI